VPEDNGSARLGQGEQERGPLRQAKEAGGKGGGGEGRVGRGVYTFVLKQWPEVRSAGKGKHKGTGDDSGPNRTQKSAKGARKPRGKDRGKPAAGSLASATWHDERSPRRAQAATNRHKLLRSPTAPLEAKWLRAQDRHRVKAFKDCGVFPRPDSGPFAFTHRVMARVSSDRQAGGYDGSTARGSSILPKATASTMRTGTGRPDN